MRGLGYRDRAIGSSAVQREARESPSKESVAAER